MENVLTKVTSGPKLQQQILQMRQVLRVAQTTIDTGGAGPSEKWPDPVEADRHKTHMDRLMQQHVDRMYNRNRIAHKRDAYVEAFSWWRIAAERKREWNKPRSRSRSRSELDEFTYQSRRKMRAIEIVEHWEAEGTPEAERSEATVDRDMLAKAATAYFTSKKGDRFAVAENLTRKTHYWYNKCRMSKAIHSWRDVARARKAKAEGKKLAEARRAAQEHCNAIMRKQAENLKQKEAKLLEDDPRAAPKSVPHKLTPGDPRGPRNAKATQTARSTPPPVVCNDEPPLLSPESPPPPSSSPEPSEPAAAKRPVGAIETVTTHAEWRRDYQKELARVQADSKMQWDTGTGWAAGAHTLWLAYGGQDYVNARVRERQQWDVQCATFWANAKHMERVRQRQREAVDTANRSELKEAADKYLFALEAMKTEHAAALQAEERAHEAKQRAAEADFQAKLETISGQNASLDAFEAENRTLLHERANLFCGRLRARLRAHEPNAVTSRLAPKHECVVCLDATCTHLATTCGHVIGCGACCASLTACPICCATTTFVEMRFLTSENQDRARASAHKPRRCVM